MPKYEYGRIAKLSEGLKKAKVDPKIIRKIMEGGESIRKSTPPEKKTEWLREAMLRMDKLLDLDIRRTVRESCACCLGGKRLKLSKAIAKQNDTLEERIRAANETKFVFGHEVTMQNDGRILVRFAPEGLPGYYCACLGRNVKEPLSRTYCFCCGGHVKHHLQIALGRNLLCETRSTALSSGGKEPCTFIFTIKD